MRDRKWQYAGFFIIVIVFCLLSIRPVSAAMLTVNGSVVNIRSGPGTGFLRSGVLLKGARVPVVEQQRDWIKIRLRNGQTGWIAASLAILDKAVSSPSQVIVTGKTVNLRQSAGLGARIVGKVAKGDRLPLLGQVNDWYKVSFNGNPVYVNSEYARVMEAGPSEPPAGVTLPIPDYDISRSNQENPRPEAPTPDTLLPPEPDPAVPAPDTGQPDNTTSSASRIPEGITVFLDPGHGGKDPGAIGPSGSMEKDLNLKLALLTAAALRDRGIRTDLTRSDDIFVDLYSRPALANSGGAALMVSIHCNASESPSKRGTTVYYSEDPPNGADARRRLLASTLYDHLVPGLGLEGNGVRTGSYVVARYTDMPSALVETAYLSNPGEEALLNEPGFQNLVAASLVDGILAYLETAPVHAQSDARSDFLSQFDHVS